jgi:hypothetical protein
MKLAYCGGVVFIFLYLVLSLVLLHGTSETENICIVLREILQIFRVQKAPVIFRNNLVVLTAA